MSYSFITPVSSSHVAAGYYPKLAYASQGRTLKLFYFEAGGGHRSAAIALREVMKEQFPHWRVELVDLFSEVLRPLDPLHRLDDRYRLEDIYNGIIKRGWTYGFDAMMRLQKKLIKFYAPDFEKLLQHYWRQSERPDLVVSVVPLFNAMMARTLQHTYGYTPFVTVMTDLADCPPQFWQENKDHHIICGSEKAAGQARLAGYRPQRIFRTSGMILKPQFYHKAYVDGRRERLRLGLDPDKPTALIMFGGNGAKTATSIVDRLNRSRLGVQSVVLCGRNEKLRSQLAIRKACHAVGFTEKVPYFMRLADFFIGKPGPGSISEALHMGLPVIVEYNSRTMPQERYNAEWVEQHGYGVTIKSFAHIVPAVKALLRKGEFERLRGQIRQFDNRAVYEIPEIFDHIVSSQNSVILG